MYNDNLIIDKENKVLIPQNNKVNFKIKKSIFIKNCIEIKIIPFSEVDMINLYLIIKSYVSNLIYVSVNIFTYVNNKNDNGFIVYNSNITEFKNLSYYGFFKWFYEQSSEDWKYIKEDGEYYFMINYTIEIFDMDLLDYLKPKYPWNSTIIEKMTKLKDNEEYYIMTIEAQKKEIKILKEKLSKMINTNKFPD